LDLLIKKSNPTDDIESAVDWKKKEQLLDQSSFGGVSHVTHSLAVNKHNIKMCTVYDPENERFVVCEKTYEL